MSSKRNQHVQCVDMLEGLISTIDHEQACLEVCGLREYYWHLFPGFHGSGLNGAQASVVSPGHGASGHRTPVESASTDLQGVPRESVCAVGRSCMYVRYCYQIAVLGLTICMLPSVLIPFNRYLRST